MKKLIQNIVDGKKFALIFSIVIIFQTAFGEIKNGYETEIFQLTESLNNLKAILNGNSNLTGFQRRKIEAKITYIENMFSYHELTDGLLRQFKNIAPDLFAEIDTIKDAKGRSVNVYIKFIPKDATEVKAWGTTYIDQMKNDIDGYYSEYGELSVSVKIWIVSKALLVLSHELGHVKHQVPHLASYLNYYKKRYPVVGSYDYVGHDITDQSGQSASQFEKRFQKQYVAFLRLPNEKFENPLVLMDKIRKNLRTDI